MSDDSCSFISCFASLLFMYCHKLCIQRQMMVTVILFFMLCRSSLLSTVISFVYKDKWLFDESMSVTFCMESTERRILLFPLHTNSSLNQA